MHTVKHQKQLRCGYTTGSCAAGAAGAATQLLLTGLAPQLLYLSAPSGAVLTLQILDAHFDGQTAVCAVRKDSGDDPDVTNGIRIFARVTRGAEGVRIDGGAGVGRVTRAGLSCAVGGAAINPVPRAQIELAVRTAAEKNEASPAFDVLICAENGEQIAKKTFNSRLGILGGISILGTSGIVEPMSEQALIDTIHVEMDSRFAASERALLACPGNYGQDFTHEVLHIDAEARAITVSNFIGEALDYAVYKGFESLLLVGHAGKLIKLAAGVMQTHSAFADGRQEIFAAHAALCGAKQTTVQGLMDSITVDECLGLLQAAELTRPVLTSIGIKISEHLHQRTRGAMQIEWILFTNASGELIRSAGASALLKQFEES